MRPLLGPLLLLALLLLNAPGADAASRITRSSIAWAPTRLDLVLSAGTAEEREVVLTSSADLPDASLQVIGHGGIVAVSGLPGHVRAGEPLTLRLRAELAPRRPFMGATLILKSAGRQVGPVFSLTGKLPIVRTPTPLTAAPPPPGEVEPAAPAAQAQSPSPTPTPPPPTPTATVPTGPPQIVWDVAKDQVFQGPASGRTQPLSVPFHTTGHVEQFRCSATSKVSGGHFRVPATLDRGQRYAVSLDVYWPTTLAAGAYPLNLSCSGRGVTSKLEVMVASPR